MDNFDVIEISSTSSDENIEKTGSVSANETNVIKIDAAPSELIIINSSSSESERAESEDGDDSNESCYDADAEGDVEATRNRERNTVTTAARSMQFGNPEKMNVVPNRCRGKQLWSSSESSDSDYEGRNKGSQPLEPGPPKRPRFSDDRNLGEELIDVAVASASNVEPPVIEDEEELAVSSVYDMDVQGATADVELRSVATLQGSEDETVVLVPARVPVLPPTEITYDFRLMNQRMQVLERSMRYVAAQIVAMTANRPSPANMRLWAQQQFRAEQERIAQTPNYFGNSPGVSPEMQAQLQLQIQTQVQTQLDNANEEEDESVQGLPEPMIREHLENNTEEFPYSTNSTRETKCIICYEDFEKGISIRRLRCEHCYHRHCIDHWFTTSQLRCPMCRANIALD